MRRSSYGLEKGRVRTTLVALSVIVVLLLLASVCFAQEMFEENGISVCRSNEDQGAPRLAPSQSDSFITAWEDDRNEIANGTDVYAQLIDSQGNATWQKNGIPVCTARGDQFDPVVVEDGSGGAFIAWQDRRDFATTGIDIYAQRVDSSGNTAWTQNGIPVCTDGGNQRSLRMVSDGSTAAILTWQSSGNIFAGALKADGNSGWSPRRVTVCSAGGTQQDPRVTGDGCGGAIATWTDARSGTREDIYAQRIGADGEAAWQDNGIAVCDAAGDGSHPGIASDGEGGAYLTWQDSRSQSETGWDIYAQRLNGKGEAEWKPDGIAVCDEVQDQESPQVTSSGSDTAIVAWEDWRDNEWEIYTQRLYEGSPSWAEEGVNLSISSDEDTSPKVVSDGAGGAVVTWIRRGWSFDLVSQSVTAEGLRPWHQSGEIIYGPAQDLPEFDSGSLSSGNIAIAWEDWRDKAATGSNIYAQKLYVHPSASTYYFAEGTCRPGFDPYLCIQNPNQAEAQVTITYMRGDGTTQDQSLSVPANSRSTVVVKDTIGEGDDEAHDFSCRVECINGQNIVVERPMYFNYMKSDPDHRTEPGYGWCGGHDVMGATSPAPVFYFAEGTCRPDFDTYLCIQNPNQSDAQVTITYMKGDGTTEAENRTVRANSRCTVAAEHMLGEGEDEAHDFSCRVECINGQNIVVERPMYFDYRKGWPDYGWCGGHDVMGATSPASTFYFAEGTCRPGFDPYLCIQNPNDEKAQVTITYMKGDGTTQDQSLSVPANSRSTVVVKDTLGEGDDEAHDFSCRVESAGGLTIIAERPMYFDYRKGWPDYGWCGGHDVMGATSPASTFYFAEGTCRPGFDPYLCIQNPNDEKAQVTITYMKGDGTTQDQSLSVPANSRSTVVVKDTLGEGDDEAHDFSCRVESAGGLTIIAERPMYFNYRDGRPGYGHGWSGGHDVIGIE